MHSFVFNVEKLQNSQLQHAHAHNVRARPTSSQLPREAWFTPEGRHELVEWSADRLAVAHALARRKDAVEALSFVIQFGDQTDWREQPTASNKHGKPRNWPVNLKQASEAIQRWAVAEFGAENVVSLELHTDESTPHFHLICTPIHDNKLQAKHWLNGAASVAALRKRAHAEISKTIPCTYTPGQPGGEPHDPSKAAGAANARQPVAEVGLLGRLKGDDIRQENERLRSENAKLQAELKTARQAARMADKARLRRADERALQQRAESAEAQLQQEKARHDARENELQNELRGVRSELASVKDAAMGNSLLIAQLSSDELGVLVDRHKAEVERHAYFDQLQLRVWQEDISTDEAATELQNRGLADHFAKLEPASPITSALEAQKRALSAPQHTGQAKPSQQEKTRQNAPKRDYEPPSPDF